MTCQPVNPQPQFKSNIKTESLNGGTFGEAFQSAFHNQDFVITHPNEGQSVVTSSRAWRQWRSRMTTAFVQSIEHLETDLKSFSSLTSKDIRGAC